MIQSKRNKGVGQSHSSRLIDGFSFLSQGEQEPLAEQAAGPPPGLYRADSEEPRVASAGFSEQLSGSLRTLRPSGKRRIGGKISKLISISLMFPHVRWK